jgi:uncharacterized membrane protein YhaH (DUF805 family)
MINAYVKMWKNGFDFSGRTRRRDYWLAFLMNILIALIVTLPSIGNDRGYGYGYVQYNAFQMIYSLIVFIPFLAISVRRLHDIGRSGFWLFIGLVPIIGGIILLVFDCTDSAPDNEYGLNPKIES